VNTKVCTKCGAVLPATAEYFHRRNDSRDGLRADCKTCNCERVRLWGEANRERHVENACRWQKANPERRKVHCHRYYEANRERCAENGRRWTQANPDKVRSYVQNRRARKASAPGSHTAKDIRAQYDSQKGRCWWCGCELNGTYHADHRIPLAIGGSNSPENIVIACPTCNLSKGTKMPHEWNGRLL